VLVREAEGAVHLMGDGGGLAGADLGGGDHEL